MKAVTILFFADSHLGFDYPVKGSSTTPRRGADFFRNYEFILRTAKERKVDLVIHGGDLFDRSKVHPRIVNRAYEALFNFAESGIPLVLVPGNHDRSTLPSSLFLQHKNLHIFYNPGIFPFSLKGTTFYICGFPFIRNIGDEIKTVIQQISRLLPERGISILCMHQAVEGAKVGPVDYTFRPGSQVIRASDLTGPFTTYLSGHIHRHQVMQLNGNHDKKLLIYPGSIERTSFAERNEEKGFVYLTYNNRELPEIVFQHLPSKPMYYLKIGEDIMERINLEAVIANKIRAIDDHAILRISSPNKAVSKLIRKMQQHAKPNTIHWQIHHEWLRNSHHD